MKLKRLLLSILGFCSAGAILTACGGTGNAGPMANAGYGDVVSISAQNFAGMESVPIELLNNITLHDGYYSESSTEFVNDALYTMANADNTRTSYNYDIEAITENAAKLGISTVSAFAVQYKTPGQNANTIPDQVVRTASGLVVVPNTTTTPIRGVVVYFHPTTFGKNDVPSCILGSGNVPAYCHSDKSPLSAKSAGLADFASFASIYAARGFVVVAPDYVGQGADWDNVHPYVAYPETNALSAFYMFPAMRQILATRGVSTQTTLPLFITGYSEGGGYALKASQMAQGVSANILAENNLSLKITAPQEGAYSLTDQMNFAFANLNDGVLNCADNQSLGFICGQSDAMESDNVTIMPIVSQMNNWNIGSAVYAAATKPALTSYVLTAAMYYNFYNLSSAYDFAMNHQFWSHVPMLGSGVIETLYGLYSGNGIKYTGGQISGSIVYNTTNINNYDVSAESYPVNFYLDPNLAALAQTFIPNFTGNVLPIPDGGLPPTTPGYGLNNQGSSFINQGIQTNPQFISLLANGSTYNWQTKSPINLIHMNYDSAVTVVNAHQAYSCMKYGKSFAGSGDLVGSTAACTTAPSGNLIESTIIANYQLTNNTQQLSPYDIDLFEVNKLAHSQFWSPISTLIGNNGALAPLNGILGIPFDHGDMFVLGNIVALCTFENQLDGNNANSGVCPNF